MFLEKSTLLFSSYICQLFLYHLTWEMKLIKYVLGDEGGERRRAEGTEGGCNLLILMLFDTQILVNQSDTK